MAIDLPVSLEHRITRRGFTLLEMLVVLGIIAILLVALIPAVNSLSKSSGRKGAITNLIAVIEQARLQAVKDSQPTYLVFPTFASAPATTLDRYNYKAYAIFEEDPANPTTPKQLTPWKTLPSGISFRANSTTGNALSNLATLSDLPAPAPSFSFSPDASANATYYLLKFSSGGELEVPPQNVVLGVFEGFVANGTESFTAAKSSKGNPLASEYLIINQRTGRAAPTATPSQ